MVSLAITDVLGSILRHLKNKDRWGRNQTVEISYVLNDTSNMCLGTGQQMLNNYFRIGGQRNNQLIHRRTVTISKAFPSSMNQLERISHNIGSYGLVSLSYVLDPLNKEEKLNDVISSILEVGKFCSSNSRILILQDRFRAPLIRRVAKGMGVSAHRAVLTQHVYSSRNNNELYTYIYYRCLYSPGKDSIAHTRIVA